MLTGEGWLDNVGTLLPRLRYLVILTSPSSSPGLSAAVARARSVNPRLSVLLDKEPLQYNEDVELSGLDVLAVLQATPRLGDLKAGRVGHADVLAEAARRKQAENDWAKASSSIYLKEVNAS
jgi:hypothetical protein